MFSLTTMISFLTRGTSAKKKSANVPAATPKAPAASPLLSVEAGSVDDSTLVPRFFCQWDPYILPAPFKSMPKRLAGGLELRTYE